MCRAQKNANLGGSKRGLLDLAPAEIWHQIFDFNGLRSAQEHARVREGLYWDEICHAHVGFLPSAPQAAHGWHGLGHGVMAVGEWHALAEAHLRAEAEWSLLTIELCGHHFFQHAPPPGALGSQLGGVLCLQGLRLPGSCP